MTVTDEQLAAFRTEAQAELNGTQVLNLPADLTLRVQESTDQEGEVHRTVYGTLPAAEPIPLTGRAVRSLQRLTGISDLLVRELPLEQVNLDLRHQLINRNQSLGIIRAPINGLMSICGFFLPHKRPYVSYADMLPNMPITSLNGSPIQNEYVQLMTVEDRLTVDNEQLTIGISACLSSTGMAPSYADMGFYRGVCTNSGIDQGTRVRMNSMDADIVRAAFTAIRGRVPAYKDKLERMIRRAKQTNFLFEPEEQFEAFVEHLKVSQKIKKVIKLAAAHPDDCRQMLQAAGVERVTNLWDAVNVITHMANLTGNLAQRISLMRESVTWAKAITGPSSLN